MERSGKVSGVLCSRTGDKEEDEKLLEPFTYILQVPGGLLHPKFAQAFNYWLKVPEDKVIEAGEIAEMAHTAGLVIDDIEDNSILRRGIPVAHSIYGVPNTINSVFCVILILLEKVLSLKHPDAIKAFSEEMLQLFRGQGIEIYWRDNYTCPSVEEYQEMTKKKTAAQLKIAVRLVQAYSENKTDFTKLIDILGLYFQIFNDYRSLLQEYSQDKDYCEDITEGKFSFPIIHAIKSRPDDSQVMNILRQRTRDVEVKKHCITLLENFGSLSHTRRTLEKLDAEVRTEVAKLGGNPLLEDLLDELISWKEKTDG